MKINTQIVLKDLKGKEIEIKSGENFTLGDALSNVLVSAKEGGKMKMFTLALKLANEEYVDVDASDLSMIKEAVKKTEIYNALVAGQCELILEDVKEEKKD
jgi:DNA-directed RNA polymerase subunit L